MSKILAVTNVKGGVGKTTTAVNLAAALAERGQRVLAVDLDPQASLTISFGFDPYEQPRTIQHLLDASDDLINATILSTAENLDLIPANFDLRSLERELESHPTRLFAVNYALKPLRQRYDYILLDCPANAGTLTGAALAASDKVIVPLTPDFLAMQVAKSLFRIIEQVQKRVNPRLEIAGIYLTMYDGRTRHTRDIFTALHETYGSSVPFFSVVVHQSVKLKEAPAAGKSILKYAPSSQAAQAYRIIAEEIEGGIRVAPVSAVPAALPDVAEVEESGTSLVERSLSLESVLFQRRQPAVLTAEAGEPASPDQGEQDQSAPVASEASTPTDADLHSADFWIRRGEAATDRDDSIRCFGLALELDPHNEEARRGLEARLSKRVAEAEPGEARYMMALAQFLNECGYPQYAERASGRAKELDPSVPEPVGKALAPAADNDTRVQEPDTSSSQPGKQARETLTAVAIKENLRQQATKLVANAAALSQSGDSQQAHSLFRQAVVLNPLDPRAWVGCARTADNLPAKITYAKQALKIDPDNPDARDVLLLTSTFMRMSVKERWTFPAYNIRPITLGLILLLILTSLVYFLPRLWWH